jgi:hypothetical protein
MYYGTNEAFNYNNISYNVNTLSLTAMTLENRFLIAYMTPILSVRNLIY